jgi:hypothetical protein
MNQFNPRGVPLVQDASFVKSKALTTIARACLHKARSLRAHTAARNHWSDDKDLELVLRAPVDQATTGNTPILAGIAVAFISALTPASAAASVISKSLRLSLDGSPSSPSRRCRCRRPRGSERATPFPSSRD